MLLAGILYEQRVRNGKRGRMCVLSLDDGTARIEVVVYSEVFDKRRALIVDDHPLIVRGKVSYDDFSGGMRVIADEIYDIDTARRQCARRLDLYMNGQANSATLKNKLSPHLAQDQPGSCPVVIHYNNGEAEVDVPLPDNWRVRVSEPLIQSLNDWLTDKNVRVTYDAAPMAPPPATRGYGNRGGGYSQGFGSGEE
jgi:DNA polymerase-3 subunit alpha